MAVLNFTSREFRSRRRTCSIWQTRAKRLSSAEAENRAYTLVPIEDDDLAITSELQMRIEEARAEIKAGKCTTLRSQEDIDAYFEAL